MGWVSKWWKDTYSGAFGVELILPVKWDRDVTSRGVFQEVRLFYTRKADNVTSGGESYNRGCTLLTVQDNTWGGGAM